MGEDHKSDWDFIVVVKDNVVDRDIRKSSGNKLNANIFQESSFIKHLNRHKMSILECIFLPKELMLKNKKEFKFNLDIKLMIKYVIEKSREDWAHAKKLFHENDPNFIKPIFHILRSLNFTDQIIDNKKIINYSQSNDYYSELCTVDYENWSSSTFG